MFYEILLQNYKLYYKSKNKNISAKCQAYSVNEKKKYVSIPYQNKKITILLMFGFLKLNTLLFAYL